MNNTIDITNPSLEDVIAAGADSHQQELDHQELREIEIRKLLRLYNCHLMSKLNDAGFEWPTLDDFLEVNARLFVIDAKLNSIKL